MWPPRASVVLVLAAIAAPVPAQRVHWLWLGKTNDDQTLWFRRRFDLKAMPQHAVLTGSCDNEARIWVNGKLAVDSKEWTRPFKVDVASLVKAGANTIRVKAHNVSGPAGFCARFESDVLTFGTDAQWRAGPRRTPKLRPRLVAPLGAGPWAGAVNERSLARAVLTGPHGRYVPKPARRTDALTHPEGFVVELLAVVPRSLGSWISLAKAPGNTLYASSQRGGLFVVEPARIGDATAKTTIRELESKLSGMHGLLWSRGTLFAVCNGKSGLYALRDTTGDGEFDEVRLLRRFEGAGEHGPHAVVADPDGEHLLIVAGNYTSRPELAWSRLPRRWAEDDLVPQIRDPHGHAAGIRAPGAWIARVDREGKQFELVASGFRNPFDIAVAPDGELFTYDADMEWDLGMPWYRPTRICHVVSGADFGWRAGSAKWPTWVEDSLPPALEVGPGSPTGLLFGTGARFPRRYQSALFALDWTFGTIWAVHLRPESASYRGTKEAFVTGAPLPLCDAVIGGDGAMYAVTGGRGLQSELYRIRYAGTPDAPLRAAPNRTVMLRRSLERMHAAGAKPDLDLIFENLGHTDRFVAYAARVALEHVPLEQWMPRVLALEVPLAKARGLIALARCAPKSERDTILAAVETLPLEAGAAGAQLAALRALELVVLRLGPLVAGDRARIGKRLLGSFRSAGDVRVARELGQLLARFKTPGFVAAALDRMEAARSAPLPDWVALAKRNATYGSPIRRLLQNPPPTEGLFYAEILRGQVGWTQGQRRRYFAFLNKARGHPGGNSYKLFVEQFRREALAGMTQDERTKLQPVLRAWFRVEPDVEVEAPKGPGRTWTLAAALELVAKPLRGRSHAAGKNLFRAATCFRCHRFDGEGGSVGPDLTSVAGRLGARGLVEAIIDPDLAVSDQYVATRVVTQDDRIYEGLVVDKSRGRPDGWIEVWPRQPDEDAVRLRNREVKSRKVLKTSPMPKHLADPLAPDELADLIAYILSGGDPKHAAFQR